MVTSLNENQIAHGFYSYDIHILTTGPCLVLLIVNVSQIDWLCWQLIGISKQALRFRKKWDNFTSQMKI